jgi:hypothetical protein
MIRTGSWIIMDNGGAAGDILDSIVESGNRYLTRVKLNSSDDIRMMDNAEKWEYVEDGVCCIRHTFDHSGRTTYLFFSADGYNRSYRSAVRRVDRMITSLRSYEDGKFRMTDFVTVKKNVAADVDVKVTVQTHLDYDDPRRREHMIMNEIKPRSGIFKLESSEQLTSPEALYKYRGRSSVEHLISSFKSVSGMKPLRVWKKASIHGSVILALLSEMVIAMARYELDHKTEKKMRKGKMVTVERRPSTNSMVWSLSQLTVTRIIEKGSGKRTIYSNWNPISRAVFVNIRSNSITKGVLAST